jgi:hypothetical protein
MKVLIRSCTSFNGPEESELPSDLLHTGTQQETTYIIAKVAINRHMSLFILLLQLFIILCILQFVSYHCLKYVQVSFAGKALP